MCHQLPGPLPTLGSSCTAWPSWIPQGMVAEVPGAEGTSPLVCSLVLCRVAVGARRARRTLRGVALGAQRAGGHGLLVLWCIVA